MSKLRQNQFWWLLGLCLLSHLCMAKSVDTLIERHARQQGLDVNLVRAMILVESHHNPKARSPKNALGLMQVMPATALRMGVRPERLFEAEPNLIAGTRYLAFLQKRFHGNLDLMLAGYNAGEGAVAKYGGVPPYRETIDYVEKVKRHWLRLSGLNEVVEFQPSAMVAKSFWLGAPLSSLKDLPLATRGADLE